MFKTFFGTIFGFLLCSILGCQTQKHPIDYHLPPVRLLDVPFIPLPNSIVQDTTTFALDSLTQVHIEEGWMEVRNQLIETIHHKYGFELDVNQPFNAESRQIVFSIDSLPHGLEAYRLKVSKDTILIHSNSVEGAFRAVQTFTQMLPDEPVESVLSHDVYAIPGGEIDDFPSFSYRGTMLDVARHFFSVDEVKKHIDILSAYKINYLHLHLTDDQGWRIEIKKWPKLTKVGGQSEVGGGKGGFFTQADYSEIVDYAQKKFNASQLTAIAASAHEYGEGGFTCIKGPPGTGSKYFQTRL